MDVKPHKSIDSGAYIGQAHLKVADVERAIAFYHDAAGFDVTQRWGDQAAAGYHHIGLNTRARRIDALRTALAWWAW